MRALLVFTGALLLIVAVAWYAHRSLDLPPENMETHRVVVVPPDASFNTVAGLLAQKGLLVSPFWFRVLGKVQGAERNIKPGEYDFHTRMRPPEILDALIKGRVVQYTILVPEGFTAAQIATLLNDAELADEAVIMGLVRNPAFVKSLGVDAATLEGYLYPDTYHFPRHTRPEEILKTMVDRFHQFFTPEVKARASELNMTEHEVVTLASIIEKETGQQDERPLIAAVFQNRLKKKYPLQSDPTVIYDIPNFDGNLTRAQLTTSTPFNTYMHAGLPPGPIANPGIKSILAALHPAPVSYLYFVSKNDGSHQFSSTLDEHNQAVHHYQKKRTRPSAERQKQQ